MRGQNKRQSGTIPMNYRHWFAESKLIPFAALIGFLGWNGNVSTMLGLPLVAWIWRMAPSRLMAFFSLLAYYLVANRGALRGAVVFYSDPLQKPSLVACFAIWLVPGVLLATTWAVLWGRRFMVGRLAAILLIVSIPPIGILGWANPLTAAGVWFPGFGWWGLIAFLSLLLLLVSTPAWQRYGIVVLTCVAVSANAFYTAPAAGKWLAIDTHFQPSKNDAGEYSRMRELLYIAEHELDQATPGSVIVLPEAVGGNWEVNGPFWERLGKSARDKKVTFLVGAQRAIDGSEQYVNGLYGTGFEDGMVIPGRMPVPISMWMPFSKTGATAPWQHPGITVIHGQRAAHLICYEQLLIWPVLQSMAASPSVVIAVANDWWATDTSIPKIQRQVVAAWARLFAIPAVFAMNE